MSHRGDGPGTVAVVGAVLWFCATLAVGATMGHAAWLVDSGGEDDLASVDWQPLWTTALVWMAMLNVPVWIAGAIWWRRRRRLPNDLFPPTSRG
ncbi:MAG: hypothetical protein AAF791_04975 [Bacteroidota bacterium]